VYADADIYLLDDPLSAVDARVGRHLMEHCIRGILKKKLVILVTHQVYYLQKATEILKMSRGRIVERGTYKQLSIHESSNGNGMPIDAMDVAETWEIIDLGNGETQNLQYV